MFKELTVLHRNFYHSFIISSWSLHKGMRALLFEVMLLIEENVWNIPLLICFLILFGLYLFFITKIKSITINPKQPILFLIGLSLLYLSTGSPLATLSHLSFSTHMLQMSVQYFIIPPLLLLGGFSLISYTSKIIKINNFPLAPKASLVIFAGLFLVYHLPIASYFLSQNSTVQNIYMTLLLLFSLRMWWPIISTFYTKQEKKSYALLSAILISPACLMFILYALIDETQNPFLNHSIAHLCVSPQFMSHLLPSIFNTKYDQMIAGTLMLGVHKLGIILTFLLRYHDKVEKE